MPHIYIAVKEIKSVSFGIVNRRWTANPPFTYCPRDITCFLQFFTQGVFSIVERHFRPVSPDGDMSCMKAG